MSDETIVKDDTTAVVKDEDVSGKADETKDADLETKDTKDEKDTKEADLKAEEKKAAEAKAASVKSEDGIQEILDKHGYDSYEDLENDFESFKELKNLIGNKDAKKLIEDSEYLAKVKEHWKEQEEAKKLEDESFEETADRYKGERDKLEKDLKERDKLDAKKDEDKAEKVKADKLLKSFNSTVKGEIDKISELPKEYKSFLREFLGVDNPANEIDIGLKPEVRSMAKEGIKKFQDLEQLIIKRYRDGKIAIPKITKTEDAPVTTDKKPKSLKEARTALHEAYGLKQ